VNPFILLLKPMMAVGTFITKLVVAAGMVAADGREPAEVTKVDTEVAIVRVAVSPEDHSLSEMEVELPNGEFYALAGTGTDDVEAASPAFTARRPGSRMSGRTHTVRSSNTVAMLESETGHSMRCNMSMPSDDESGSAVCTTDRGKTYEITFDL
jgi:hypothetical protein